MAAAAEVALWSARRPTTPPVLVASAGSPDERLASLSRARAPLRRALAALAGCLVAGRGWERLGYARLRDYATERLGCSARSLQDLAYVDRALTELPQLERACAGGALDWTKVRLLARVATAADEARWIRRAERLSVRALEREVRRVDIAALESGGVEVVPTREAACGPTECVRIRCTPVVRARWWRVRQLARRTAGESVSVWEAMEQVAAEVASALPVEAPPEDEGGSSVPFSIPVRRRLQRVAADGCAARGAPSLPSDVPAFVQSLVAGLDAADPFALDARLRRGLTREQRLEAEVSALLLRVVEAGHHRIVGFANLEGYARERLGMSPRKLRALLRLERAGRRCPALRRAYREGRISWVQAHELVPVAYAKVAAPSAWVEWAQTVSVRRLADAVGRAMACRGPEDDDFPPPPGGEPAATPAAAERQTGAPATVVEARPPRSEETASIFFNAPRPAARFFRAVLCSVRRHLERRTGRLPSEGEGFGWMLAHALEAWVAGAAPGPNGDPSQRRLARAHVVFARDGWRCTVPGCTSYRNLHDHHIRFRSAGGSDDLWNRTTLCAHHHQRGVHAGIVRCLGRAPGGLRFELGLRPGQPPLAVYGSGDVVIDQP